MAGYTLWRSISDKLTVVPYVQNSLLKHTWPDKVEIPSPFHHDSHTDDYFHPSTHAIYGELAIYTMLHPVLRQGRKDDREHDYSRFMTPLFGTVYHVIIQSNLVNDGLVGPEDIEIALVDEERHWRGHADLLFKGELVDIKSMNSRSFDRILSPYDSWKHQLNCYMDRMGLDTSLVLLVEMGMPWRMKEFRVNKDQKLLDHIYGKWERVREALKTDTPPTTCCLPAHSTYCPVNCKGLLSPA